MNQVVAKIGAVLAFIIGVMAVVAGGRVLMGIMPDYYVIDWVPVYNFIVGVISALVTAVLIWRNSKIATAAAVTTLASHALVMLILQTAYREVVAPDSIRAMTVRITAWIIILGLMAVQARINSRSRQRPEAAL